MTTSPDTASLLADAARFGAGSLPLWTGEDDDRLVVRQIRVETHDVKTFVLAPLKPATFRWQPGQFLTLELEINGETIFRSYTISASPTRPDTLAITVKRVSNGPVSNWLHDHLKTGDLLKVSGPMGDFTFLNHPAQKYLFFAGGSGITPLMSMTRTLADLAGPMDMVFINNVRSAADVIFGDELALIDRQNPGFRFAPITEQDTPLASWAGYKGRISLDMLKTIAPDFLTREVFVCGPSPYMKAVKAMLIGAGFPEAQYHEESFNFEELTGSAPAAEAAQAAPEVKTFKIILAKTGKEFDCDSNTFILDAGRRAGARFPSACAKGMCGTCKSKINSGTLDMNHNGGIRQREIDAGLALLCCSRPTSDLVIDR